MAIQTCFRPGCENLVVSRGRVAYCLECRPLRDAIRKQRSLARLANLDHGRPQTEEQREKERARCRANYARKKKLASGVDNP